MAGIIQVRRRLRALLDMLLHCEGGVDYTQLIPSAICCPNVSSLAGLKKSPAQLLLDELAGLPHPHKLEDANMCD